ncbi:MAG: periplasmic heavy metal sensor [Candidatus Aerophobetes bacterium]|nr:periplasmic heavy metal sensor [Candidatus Aerophobetes bacterium]
MKKKIIIILVVVFAGGLFSGFFIPKLFKKENLPSSPTNFLCKYLSLSESQKEKMESLNRVFYLKAEKIKDQLNQERIELSELLGESSLNWEKIDDKVSKIVSLQAQLQRETVNHLGRIKSILTPEQKIKFFSLIRRRLHHRGPWKRDRKGRF